MTVVQAQVVSGIDFGNCETTNACEVQSCNSTTITINTGYDPISGVVGATGSYEPNWTVCETPNPNLSVPRPSYLLTPNPAWHNQTNTAWISPFPTSSFNQNNPAPQPPYAIKYCFCVCAESEVTIDLSVLADNNVDINLTDESGVNIIGHLLSITDQTTGAFHLPATTTTNTFVLEAGQYCIKADLRNLSGVAMGLNIQGTISGANLLESICCDNTGSITGIKYNDLNCNGVMNNNESGLAGWSIVLCDAAGLPLDTTITDAAGYYTFLGLSPGTYKIKELQQEGWAQSFPGGNGEYQIGLSPKEVASDINFGNCVFCPTNIVQNGSFKEGSPTASDDDIANATGWGPIWSNGASSADFYNTVSPKPPAILNTPSPVEQGNFGAFWVNHQQTDPIWREGAMNQLLQVIPANSGCYELSMKVACIYNVNNQPKLALYGVPTGATGVSSPGATTPTNENLFTPQAIELGNYTFDSSCDEEFTTITFNFDSGNFPPEGIDRIFLTRADSGLGSTFIAIDDLCLGSGPCPCNVTAAWEYEVQDCGVVHFLDASTGDNLSYCWDFDGEISTCESTEESPVFTFPSTGSYDVCLVVTDGSSCSDTLCQTLSVIVQNDPPQIVCPENITIECDELPTADPSVLNSDCATFLDVVCSRSDDLPLNVAYPPCETVTVTCTATNNFGSTTCDYTVTTVDNIGPTAVCKADLTVVLDANSCEAFISPEDVDNGSSDNCGIVSRSLDISEIGPDLACHSIPVVLTVADCGGNTAQCTTVVFVLDNTPPSISCPPTIQVDCITGIDPVFTGFPTGSDNCPEEISFSYTDVLVGVVPCDAVITRTWTAMDTCANIASCDQTIFIADQAAPEITCPDNLTITQTDDPVPAVTGFASATDNCDMDVSVTYQDELDNPDPCPDGQIITRTWTSTDDCGNSNQCVQFITVDCVQNPGCDSVGQECLTDVLNISTGFDHLSSTFYTSARYDAFWSLVETEANVATPRPATVISPFLAAWGFQNGAEWISFYEDYILFENNEVPDPPHSFQRCFCLCSDSAEVTFDMNVMVDDIVDMNLYDASGNIVTNLVTLDNSTSPNFDEPTHTTVTVPLTGGNYCIRADVRNTDQVAMGFNLQGTLSGGVFQKAECCRPGNVIYGVVYYDEDMDGFRDFRLNAIPPEQGLENWLVQLCDLNGNILYSTHSDQYGYYEFVNVPPGDYLLKRVMPPWEWIQTEPNTPEYTITVASQDVIDNLNFGNFPATTGTVDDDGLVNITLFPNPAGNLLTVQFEGPLTEKLTIRLNDMLGQTLQVRDVEKGEERLVLDLSQLSSAVYLIELSDTQGHTWRRKFVKE